MGPAEGREASPPLFPNNQQENDIKMSPELLKFIAATSVCNDKETCERVLSGTKRADGVSVLDTINEAFAKHKCYLPIIPFDTETKWCIALAMMKDGERDYIMLGFDKTAISKQEFNTLLPMVVSDLSRDLGADVKVCMDNKPPAPWLNPHQQMMN